MTLLWVTDDEGVVAFRDVAPTAGPPPDPPLARLGPALAGALSGLILEDAGRLQLRVGGVVPPDDPTRPWRAPLAVRVAPYRPLLLEAADAAGASLVAEPRRDGATDIPPCPAGAAP